MAISVVIPIYNVENYLEQCLESIVNQKCPFHEVILIDDGSTDNSLSICEKYASKYRYFKVIRQENKGLSAARNKGLDIAEGEYILFVDSDDWLDLKTSSLLETQLSYKNMDALYFDAEIVVEDSRYAVMKNIYDRSNTGIDGKIMTGLDYLAEVYPHAYIVSACMAVYKREILEENRIRFPEGIFFEDNLFTFVFKKNAKRVEHISEKLYYRRYRSGSIMTGKFSEKKFVDYIKCIRLIWKEIMKCERKVLEKYKVLFLNMVLEYCNIVWDNYQICKKENISLTQESFELFTCFMEEYLFMTEGLELRNYQDDLVLLSKVYKNFYYLDLFEIEYEKVMEDYKRKVLEIRKKKYTSILETLPLNREGQKIGIYGTGKHTEGLLLAYETLIGKITCTLIFIDSYKDNGIYKDRSLLNYQKLDDRFDGIIISSFLYEGQMLECIKSVAPYIPVFRFYDRFNDDIFSIWALEA